MKRIRHSQFGTRRSIRVVLRQCVRQGAFAAALCAFALATAGCGVEARDYSPQVRATTGLSQEQQAELEEANKPLPPFEWPDAPDQIATLEVRGHGTVELGLYGDVAPETVANFAKLANEGFYDGTTFHRVIPGFMIQGGDPNSRDDDPENDGRGGPGYNIPDEFSGAPHTRGVVSMANKGQPNSGGSQFFIVQSDSHFLDGAYSAFARVLSGMEVVDAITEVERDLHGRWGPQDRPVDDVVIERLRVEAATGEALAAASR